MTDRHDKLRHGRIAHHASIRRKKNQVSEAHVHSGHAESSTSGAHASPQAFTSSSSHMRWVSPTDAPPPPSSRKRQVSFIQSSKVPESLVVPEAPLPPPNVDTIDAFEPMPPPIVNVVESVPAPNGEAIEDV